MNPLVSVIIPVYNRSGLLRRALKSVLNQTYKNLEVVIVDDGSDDGIDVNDSIKRYDGRFLLVRQPENLGVSSARNAGFEQSRGEWIAFLDSDDEWHRDKVSRQVEWLEKNPGFRIVQTREIWIRRGVRVNPPRTHEKIGGEIFKESLERCMITPSSVMLERGLFKEAGGFNEALPACEDYDLWLRIAGRWPVGLVDDYLLIRYGGHPDQLSSTVPVLDRFRVKALLDILKAGWLTKKQVELVRKVLGKKARIVANGYRKREKEEEYEKYRRIAEHYG